MAKFLWGNVYYQDHFAGVIQQEPGNRVSFSYDPHYLESEQPKAIAYTLPLQSTPRISEQGLPPFFDNLVAEGWLQQAQTRLLGKRAASRFELLLAFGHDLAGAVSVKDPDPLNTDHHILDMQDPKEAAILASRASLSGVQPKLAVLKDKKADIFLPATPQELSSHIAKFSSPNHPDLVENEYLTTKTLEILLPNDSTVDIEIGYVQDIADPALIIKRFDRTITPEETLQRIHFEECNQILGRLSQDKYDGSHKEIAGFITQSQEALPAQNYLLYCRILAGFLLGNTDMHFKNFAFFHTDLGYRLTPSYDYVAAILYGYKTLALQIGQSKNVEMGQLKASHLVTLGQEFDLSSDAIAMAVKDIKKNFEKACDTLAQSGIGSQHLKDSLIEQMRKRWNGTFALTGKALSKKP